MIREKEMTASSGWVALWILLSLLVLLGVLIVGEARQGPDASPWVVVLYSLVLSFVGFLLAGLFIVNPNEAKVLQLFGRYVGTVKVQGFRWANPLYTKRRISLRIRNFESGRLKVNDIEGNPIEIAAVIVWRVVETAEASFEVDNYENFVHVQSEAALRNLATSYPYDAHDDDQTSLRGQTAKVAEHLKTEIQDRLAKAGVEVIEARISHLAYAPEIAAAMLQRQQAGAIIAARQRIVEGAVGMVEMALARLSEKELLVLDEERRATMVSNLLIVLCGERAAQPVINTGTLYT
ncbi:MAG TPA: SPFH domain-containing protein [Vicinamibacterales bacterium]|nr:SPFH domain-containing protein [Vicinamibacterales bacterium]